MKSNVIVQQLRYSQSLYVRKVHIFKIFPRMKRKRKERREEKKNKQEGGKDDRCNRPLIHSPLRSFKSHKLDITHKLLGQ